MCFLSVGLGQARRPRSQAGIPQPSEQAADSQPPAVGTDPIIHESILPCWRSIHKQVHDYLRLRHRSFSGEAFSQIALYLWLEVKRANPSYAALLRLIVWLCCCPQPGGTLPPPLESYKPKGYVSVCY